DTIMGYEHDDPSLRTGADGLTVWTLHEMCQGKQFDELNDLFNNGLTMNSLPVGLAAGTAPRVFCFYNKGLSEAPDRLSGEKLAGEGVLPVEQQESFHRKKPNESSFGASKLSDRPDVQVRYDAFGQPCPDAEGKIECCDSKLHRSANQTILAGTGFHEDSGLRH